MITKEQKEKAGHVAKILHDAFVWSETQEGHNYWSEIEEKLRNIKQERCHICECKGDCR